LGSKEQHTVIAMIIGNVIFAIDRLDPNAGLFSGCDLNTVARTSQCTT
jgi:hypothetical protein